MTARTAVAIAMAGVLSAAGRADASCLIPPLRIVWSYPADGQTDVPTNAQIVLMQSVYLGGCSTVALDGATIEPGDHGFQFRTPPMAPNTDHVVTVTHDPILCPALQAETATLRFRTSAGPLDSHPSIPERLPIVWEQDRDLTAGCQDVLASADCYDTRPCTTLNFLVTQTPLAWVVRSREGDLRLWPGVCGAPVVRECMNRRTRYSVTAINEIGESTVSGPYLHGREPNDVIVVSSDEPSFLGCTAATGAMPLVGVVPALLALHRWRRRVALG